MNTPQASKKAKEQKDEPTTLTMTETRKDQNIASALQQREMRNESTDITLEAYSTATKMFIGDVESVPDNEQGVCIVHYEQIKREWMEAFYKRQENIQLQFSDGSFFEIVPGAVFSSLVFEGDPKLSKKLAKALDATLKALDEYEASLSPDVFVEADPCPCGGLLEQTRDMMSEIVNQLRPEEFTYFPSTTKSEARWGDDEPCASLAGAVRRPDGCANPV
jgi:hypothetical protein